MNQDRWYDRTSLEVRWLRLCSPNAGGPGSIPGQGTRSHMAQLRIWVPQPEISHAASKTHSACMCAKSLQLCSTLWDPIDYSPLGSSVHGILQAKILEWVSMPSSKGSFPLRDLLWFHVSDDLPALADGFFCFCFCFTTNATTWEAQDSVQSNK